MRKWIDLLESVEDNTLYHGTSIIGFCHIARANMLGAYGGEDQASFTLSPDVGKTFAKISVSFCADGQLAQYKDFYDDPNNEGWDGKPYSAHKAEVIAGGQGAVLAFNRKALHRDYHFKAVNFKSDDLATIDMEYSGKEQEECVFENVMNLDRYVTGLLIDRDGFNKYCEFLRETIPGDGNAMAAITAGENWVRRFGG